MPNKRSRVILSKVPSLIVQTLPRAPPSPAMRPETGIGLVLPLPYRPLLVVGSSGSPIGGGAPPPLGSPFVTYEPEAKPLACACDATADTSTRPRARTKAHQRFALNRGMKPLPVPGRTGHEVATMERTRPRNQLRVERGGTADTGENPNWELERPRRQNKPIPLFGEGQDRSGQMSGPASNETRSYPSSAALERGPRGAVFDHHALREELAA